MSSLPLKNINTFPDNLVDGKVIGTAGGSARNFATRPWSAGRWRSVKIVTGTTYTLVADDEGVLLLFTSSSAITVNLPSDNALEWPVCGGFFILRNGTGQVTVVAAAGASLQAGGRPKFRVTGSVANVRKFAANSWLMWGDTIA